MIKGSTAELVILLACAIIYFLAKSIYYTRLLKNKNYIEVVARCTGSKHPSIGFGITNSMIFTFEITDSSNELSELESNVFELQTATTPKLSKKGAKKYPYLTDNMYVFMFKTPKSGKLKVLNNQNYLTSCPYHVNNNNKEDMSAEEKGENNTNIEK